MNAKSTVVFLLILTAVLTAVSLMTPAARFQLAWPDHDVLMDFRLPRTLNAIGVGGALALGGLLLQTLLQNPLAEPYTLGLSGGATLGAVLGLVFFHVSESTSLAFSFIGCWMTVLIILAYHSRASHASRRSLILFGLMISLFCGSFVSLILSVADGGQLQRAMSWMIGSVGEERGWRGSHVLPFLFVITIYWIIQARRLDILLLGEDSARNILGNIKSLERAILFSVSLLTSCAVAACGLIGFVGLLSPQISFRLLKTRRHRINIPASILIGMSLLLIADILGRAIGAGLDIPAGGVVALFGAPFLGWLLIKGARA